MARLSPRIGMIIEMYDQAYNLRAWHGSNLIGSLKGVKIPELIWRPNPNRHNIWEIALHCAYWKYVVLRRTVGGKNGEFPRKPSDWPTPPAEPNLKNWRDDLGLLGEYHMKLREAIRAFPESKLGRSPKESKVSYAQTFYGVASHDIYHAGQIQLLKRMQRGK